MCIADPHHHQSPTSFAEADADSVPSEEECKKYGTFWEAFGRAIKLGIIEDSSNRSRLAKVCTALAGIATT